MSSVHFHLLANHFPVIGTLFCCIILATGVLRRNKSIISTAKYLLLLVALSSIPVYFSGEGAEDALEGFPGITEEMIEDHEFASKISMISLGITALVALFSIIVYHRKKAFRNSLTYITLIFAIITMATFARTGLLGGKIRHTEIRHDASAIQLQQVMEDEEEHK